MVVELEKEEGLERETVTGFKLAKWTYLIEAL